mgnify:CR=1 FL=1
MREFYDELSKNVSMQKFELVLRDLLKNQKDPAIVADRVLTMIESEDLNFNEESIQTVSHFLFRSGFYNTLVQFVVRNLRRPRFKVPWYFFLEALARGLGNQLEKLPANLEEALLTGVGEDQAQREAMQAQAMHRFLPNMKTWGGSEEENFQNFAKQKREDLIQQVATLQTARLYEKAHTLIEQLLSLFPKDAEVQRLKEEALQQRAIETLQRRSRKRTEFTPTWVENDPEEEVILETVGRSLYQASLTIPEMSFDLAVASFMFDDFATALKILAHSEPSFANDWLRLECLLLSRHFIEGLDWIVYLEIHYSHIPETASGVQLARAKCYWGLGERHLALEILENLLDARPNHIQAGTLLNVWRNP